MENLNHQASPMSEWKLIEMIETSTLTAECLLEDESIVSIVRNNNPKVVDFVTQPSILHRLISYLTTCPPPPLTNVNGQKHNLTPTKYPFIACELLSSESEPIQNKLLEFPALYANEMDTVADISPTNSEIDTKSIRWVSMLEEHQADKERNPDNHSDNAIRNDLQEFVGREGTENKTLNKQHADQLSQKEDNSVDEPHEISSANKNSLLDVNISGITLNGSQRRLLDGSTYSFDNGEINETADKQPFAPMEILLSLFRQPPPLNPTVCGYVSKVLSNLFTSKSTQFSELVLGSLFSSFKKILHHLYNDSLCEFFEAFIKMEQFQGKKLIALAQRSEIVLLLINTFSTPLLKLPWSKELGSNFLENTSLVLNNWLSTFQTINGGLELFRPLCRSIYLSPLYFLIEKAELSQLKAITRYIKALCAFLQSMNISEETDTIQDSPLSASNNNTGHDGSFNSITYPLRSDHNHDPILKSCQIENEAVVHDLAKILDRTLEALAIKGSDQFKADMPGGYTVNLNGTAAILSC